MPPTGCPWGPSPTHHGALHLLVDLVELQRVSHGGGGRHWGFGRGGRPSAASGSVPPPAPHVPDPAQQLWGERRGSSSGGRWRLALHPGGSVSTATPAPNPCAPKPLCPQPLCPKPNPRPQGVTRHPGPFLLLPQTCRGRRASQGLPCPPRRCSPRSPQPGPSPPGAPAPRTAPTP